VRNRFLTTGNTTVIFLQHGMVTVIDTVDLAKAQSFPNTWCANKCRYTGNYYAMGRMTVDGKRRVFQLHRWLTDAPRSMQVDHFDHDGLNNRRVSNLRVTTQSGNQQNRKEAICKTGFRGVYPKGNKFKVEITVDGKRFYFGIHDDPEYAARVAIEARRRLMPFTQEPGAQDDALWDELSRKYLKSA